MLRIPVLVESPLALVAQMLSPDGLECAQATGCLDITNNANNLHRRSLNDGHGFKHFFLVRLCNQIDANLDKLHT